MIIRCGNPDCKHYEEGYCMLQEIYIRFDGVCEQYCKGGE